MWITSDDFLQHLYRERERSHTQKLQVCVHLDVCVTPVRHFLGYPTLAVAKATLPVLANLLLQMNLGGCFDRISKLKRFDSDFWIFGPSFLKMFFFGLKKNGKFSVVLNGLTKVPHFLGEGKLPPWSCTTPPPKTNKQRGSSEANQNISPLKRKNHLETIKPYFAKIWWLHCFKSVARCHASTFPVKKKIWWIHQYAESLRNKSVMWLVTNPYNLLKFTPYKPELLSFPTPMDGLKQVLKKTKVQKPGFRNSTWNLSTLKLEQKKHSKKWMLWKWFVSRFCRIFRCSFLVV